MMHAQSKRMPSINWTSETVTAGHRFLPLWDQ